MMHPIAMAEPSKPRRRWRHPGERSRSLRHAGRSTALAPHAPPGGTCRPWPASSAASTSSRSRLCCRPGNHRRAA